MATFKQYTANDSVSENFSIPTFASDEIKVRVDGELKTAATHYNITSYNANGGTVEWTSGNIPDGKTVRIYRDTKLLNNEGTDVSGKAVFNPGAGLKSDDLNDNQNQALRALEETDQLVQTYEIEDNAVTTAKFAANSLQTLADQITINEPSWLTNIGIVAGDLGLAADMGEVADASDSVTLGNVNTVATNIFKVYDDGAWIKTVPSDADLSNIAIVAGELGWSDDLGSITESLTTADGGDINTVADNITAVSRYANEY